MTIDQQAALTITGDERVDLVLLQLDRVDVKPVSEHAEVFESVLAGLRDALDGPASA